MANTRKVTGTILLTAYLAAVAYCCFGQFSDLPGIAPNTFFGVPADKVAHFLMFFPFPILCHLAFADRTSKPRHSVISVSAVFLIGAAIAAATEIGQAFTDYRSGDIHDYIADILSLAISSIIVLLADIHTKKRQTQNKH